MATCEESTNYFSDSSNISMRKSYARRRVSTGSNPDIRVSISSNSCLRCKGFGKCTARCVLEAAREIVSAEEADVKFIITDHPVTIYNAQCPPDADMCRYPEDPPIEFIGRQTLFPLEANHCLILTNLEYAQNGDRTDLLKPR
jgi:hypothetical protein